MTNSQFLRLCECKTAEEFKSAATDLDIAGPSCAGSFLVREASGKTWLFSNYRKHGRVHTASVWSELNIERMNAV